MTPGNCNFAHIHPMKHIILYFSLLIPIIATSQENPVNPDYDGQVKSIAEAWNYRDFVTIYNHFATSYQKVIPGHRFYRLLKGIQYTGRITFQDAIPDIDKKDSSCNSYYFTTELSEGYMDLRLNEANKITYIGFREGPFAYPPILGPDLSNNPMHTPLDKAVDKAAQEFRLYARFSFAIGIIKNGKRFVYLYGQQDENKLPTKETQYEIGTLTESFTTALLAQALLDKKLAMEDDIRKYLPEKYEHLQYNGVPITVRDLANHTGGLPDMPVDVGFLPEYEPGYPEESFTDDWFYKSLHNVRLDTLPGYKYQHSKWGVAILGHMLERVYGSSYTDLVKRFITGPLKMEKTGCLNVSEGGNIAYPHASSFTPLRLTDQGLFSPAGGLSSSIGDMLIYLDAQLNGKLPSTKLRGATTVNKMRSGFYEQTIKNKQCLTNTAKEMGAAANITLFPALKSGFVILVNNRCNLEGITKSLQKIITE
jgi:CubicO group peptidase (beta-lactamase class C family)